jgi:SAM-dependent methyltransferase
VEEEKSIVKKVLNGQRQHWENMFSNKPEMLGTEPSDPAQKAAELFKKEGRTKILELGGGQGRDSIFFARNGFQVHVLDYCESGVETIARKAKELGVSRSITAICHDIRKPLPFDDESFDACYSHMVYCMALTRAELEFLSDEIRRVLKPKGLNIYTVRNTKDPHYGTGTHHGEQIYEVGGFVIHFFNREMVEDLTKGFEIVSVDEFEESRLPRRLFRVTLRKK